MATGISVAVLVLVLGLGWLTMSAYNGLVSLRNRVPLPASAMANLA